MGIPQAVPAGTDIRYAGYPAAVVYDKAAKSGRAVKQLLWGDWMRVTGAPVDGFLPIRARGHDGFIEEARVTATRLLEVIFVDIGQGDGCLVVTPDDRHILVDAGEGDNMARFLRWRYNRFVEDFFFEAAVMSHSDLDHYGGFAKLFTEPKLKFRCVYTNGLMERPASKDSEILGKPRDRNGTKYIVDLVTDLPGLKTFFDNTPDIQKKKFPSMLKKAFLEGKFTDFRMLSVDDKHLPGFGPGQDVVIETLGPIVDKVDGKPALQWFKDVGKTKNGHSIVLKLTYGGVTVLLGGDLNIPSETLLLMHHSGGAAIPAVESERIAFGEKVRNVFQVDFAKACHHGSADFSRAFLNAVNPLATIISSGDDEPHSHPRADALGTIGKYSRGIRPLIFSTELARSAPEAIKHPTALRKVVDELLAAAQAVDSPAAKEKLAKRADEFKAGLNRSVATYGAINLRTDGKCVVVAQKIEQRRDAKQAWDIYRFEPGDDGRLSYVSKHEDEEADD